MRIIGIIIVVTMFFSYLPMELMGGCLEEDHHVGKKMGCEYIFHCPFTAGESRTEPYHPNLNGWYVLIPSILKVDQFPHPIFHPPEYRFNMS